MIPKELIEEIRTKADIVAIISDYVALKKRGKNYLGSCPFHSEKDPSFTVSPDKQIFHCFGCNEGGNVFSFLMKIENLNFIEAARELGTKLGIALPQTPAAASHKSEQDQLFKIAQLAAKFFEQCLAQDAGAPARTYLDQRGISEKTRARFNLGFAPPAWDNLFQYLISRGATPGLIAAAGLSLPREQKGGYYDRFRNRLIFPIFDQRGRVIAFGGRALGNDEPKYLNSPDTAIYHKGETLYGLNLAGPSLKQTKTSLLVEGYFDLISPAQAGFSNVVASLGTALTEKQCKLLARHCDNIVLVFDADSAGGLAAERSSELLRGHGLQVKVAQLQGGKDPDEVIQKAGPAVFEKSLATALPLLEFKIRRVLARHNLDEIEARGKALLEIASLLARQGESFIRKEYAKLAATFLKIEPTTLLAEVSRQSQAASGARSPKKSIAKPALQIEEAEKSLLVLALEDQAVLQRLKNELAADDFTMPQPRAIAKLLLAAEPKDEQAQLHFLLDQLADETSKFISQLLLADHQYLIEKKDEIIADCIQAVKNQRKKDRWKDIKLAISEAERAGQTQKVTELLTLLKSEIS